MEYNLDDEDKLKEFTDFLNNTDWGSGANEEKINSVFYHIAELQRSFVIKENQDFVGRKTQPQLNFKESINLVMENIMRSPVLSERLTLHAIKKYISVYSKSDFCEVLDKMLAELKLREHLVQLNEDVIDVELNWRNMNSLVDEILNEQASEVKIVNVLKSQTSDVLNAAKHASSVKGQVLVNKLISCLESQEDLKLWFLLMKEENMEIVLELCTKYTSFLEGVLGFFDKFADEIESNYDEDLNVKYSHVNLDFEDFVKIFQLFLKSKVLGSTVSEYLDSKTNLEESNFCFWLDVKACV